MRTKNPQSLKLEHLSYYSLHILWNIMLCRHTVHQWLCWSRDLNLKFQFETILMRVGFILKWYSCPSQEICWFPYLILFSKWRIHAHKVLEDCSIFSDCFMKSLLIESYLESNLWVVDRFYLQRYWRCCSQNLQLFKWTFQSNQTVKAKFQNYSAKRNFKKAWAFEENLTLVFSHELLVKISFKMTWEHKKF